VGDRQDDYSSVALWYQSESHAPFPPLPEVDFDLLELPERFRHNPLDLIEEAMERLPFAGENLALGVEAYLESGHFDIDGLGDRAFDGDYGTKWCEIDHPDAHWLALDLGSTCRVAGCVVVTPSAVGDSADFDVSAFAIERGQSLEGPWEILEARDYSNSLEARSEFAQGILPVTFERPVDARYLRLSISKSCPVDPICRIQEFQVWGQRR